VAQILVVEDDEDLRRVWVQLLRLNGHEVQETGDGHEGIHLYESFRPSVVLTDLNLSGDVHGLEVIRRLRDEPGVTTVAVSGSRTDLEAARRLGVHTPKALRYGIHIPDHERVVGRADSPITRLAHADSPSAGSACSG
jgi:CheY-like chemotaxis protein